MTIHNRAGPNPAKLRQSFGSQLNVRFRLPKAVILTMVLGLSRDPDRASIVDGRSDTLGETGFMACPELTELKT